MDVCIYIVIRVADIYANIHTAAVLVLLILVYTLIAQTCQSMAGVYYYYYYYFSLYIIYTYAYIILKLPMSLL